MGELSLHPEQTGENVQEFYFFIFDNEIPKDIGFNEIRLFEFAIDKVFDRMQQYVRDNPSTKAKVLLKGEGAHVLNPIISAVDPEGSLFIVIEPDSLTSDKGDL